MAVFEMLSLCWCWWIVTAVLAVPVVYIITSIFLVHKMYGFYGRPAYCTSTASMSGKTVIVTGGNRGIGKETSLDLATRGARVIIACRNAATAKETIAEIKEKCGSTNVVFEPLDLEDTRSIRDFAEKINKNENRLDVLVNNAGVSTFGETTKDGHDLTFFINHVGPFLLTYLLLAKLKSSAPSRIVNVASIFHTFGETGTRGLDFRKTNSLYPGLQLYAASKLANMLHCRELTRRLHGTGVTANSLHPGIVNTDLWDIVRRYSNAIDSLVLSLYLPLFAWTTRQGAQTSIYCAVDEHLEKVSGKYFYSCHVEEESVHARDDVMATQLWDVSAEMAGLSEEEKKMI